MAALCLVTVSAFIFIFAADSWSRNNRELIHDAADSSLIYRLPENVLELSSLLAMHRGPGNNEGNPQDAVKLAQLSLQQYRSSGNSRFLGAAKAALAHWSDESQPPLPVWLIRGRILQIEHLFERAANDLAALNARYPGNIEALLLESDAWRRAGQIVLAKKACLKVAFAARLDLSTFCTADILMSLGQADRASGLLKNSISRTSQLPSAEGNWAKAIYADSLVALGELDNAAEVWRSILQHKNEPLSSRLAYADLLLAQSEWSAVVDLLKDDSATTAALLRLTIAAKNIGDKNFKRMHNTLSSRFQLAEKSPGADLYLRDRALYELRIMQEPEQALVFALQNWQIQKGWEDTELVLQIAAVVDDDSAIQAIHQWRETSTRGGMK